MFRLFKPYPSIQDMLADYWGSTFRMMDMDDPEYSRWREYFERKEFADAP